MTAARPVRPRLDAGLVPTYLGLEHPTLVSVSSIVETVIPLITGTEPRVLANNNSITYTHT